MIFWLLIFAFFTVGYSISETRFFENIINKYQLYTPLKSFDFVLRQTRPIRPADHLSVISGLSPKYLLCSRRFLWCDEGAILFLTIVNKLGYRTRLVDLLDSSGISRHTIAEVFENGEWVQYDYTNHSVCRGMKYSATGFLPKPRYREYPRLFNYLVQNNGIIQYFANFIRKIPANRLI